MNYNNTTNAEVVPVMDKREPINEILCTAKDEGLDVLVLLAKLHSFLFAEEKPADAALTNIKCMYDCALSICDTNKAIQRMLAEICDRLGMM